jgi:uncharacterized protein (DUF433 family)
MARELVDAIPLAMDAGGVYRVAGTRVTLDLLVSAFDRGATPEEIVQDFPSLHLSEIYQVIGYYLKHRSELAPYLTQHQLEAPDPEQSPSESSARGLRERLLARRKEK